MKTKTDPHSNPSTIVTAKFFSIAGPVFFALVGKTVCYTSLGVAAQFTGAIPLAGALCRSLCYICLVRSRASGKSTWPKNLLTLTTTPQHWNHDSPPGDAKVSW